ERWPSARRRSSAAGVLDANCVWRICARDTTPCAAPSLRAAACCAAPFQTELAVKYPAAVAAVKCVPRAGFVVRPGRVPTAPAAPYLPVVEARSNVAGVATVKVVWTTSVVTKLRRVLLIRVDKSWLVARSSTASARKGAAARRKTVFRCVARQVAPMTAPVAI